MRKRKGNRDGEGGEREMEWTYERVFERGK